jgi:brefeldin A-resistance guanine nucleotide exchange factor 1
VRPLTLPAEIKSQDAVYVLAYSIIMLNTDLFSPQVRKRMAFEDYKRNLRGVNDGVDFSDSFLVGKSLLSKFARSFFRLRLSVAESLVWTFQRDVYDSIKKKEIILPEEHTGQLGFDYAWKELLARAPKAGSSSSCYLHLQFSID